MDQPEWLAAAYAKLRRDDRVRQWDSPTRVGGARQSAVRGTVLCVASVGLGILTANPLVAYIGWSIGRQMQQGSKSQELQEFAMHEAGWWHQARFDRLVREVAGKLGVEAPNTVVLEQRLPNAADVHIGKRRGWMMGHTALMTEFDDDSIRDILYHEFSHDRHRDSRSRMLMVVPMMLLNRARGFFPFAGAWAGASAAFSMAAIPIHVLGWTAPAWVSTVATLGTGIALGGVAGMLTPAWLGLAALTVGGVALMNTISRREEARADREAVAMGANPLRLAAGLRRLEGLAKYEMQQMAPRSLKPRTKKAPRVALNSAALAKVAKILKRGRDILVLDHPPIDERIQVLEGLAGRTLPPESAFVPLQSQPVPSELVVQIDGHSVDASDPDYSKLNPEQRRVAVQCIAIGRALLARTPGENVDLRLTARRRGGEIELIAEQRKRAVLDETVTVIPTPELGFNPPSWWRSKPAPKDRPAQERSL